MKKIHLTVLLYFIALNTIKAQQFEGIANYVSQTKIDFQLDSSQVDNRAYKQMIDLMKKQSTKEFSLEFNTNESIFKKAEKLYINKPNSRVQIGKGIMMSGGEGGITFGTGKSSLTYKNLKENSYVKKSDILGKEFLINDIIIKQDWVLENETRNIGEFTCYKATYRDKKEDKEITITAWYTLQIPVKNGPGDFDGLPGLIMQVSADDESINFVCNKVILNPKKGVTILRPKKGKQISQAEFDLIHKKKMEELRTNNRNGVMMMSTGGNN